MKLRDALNFGVSAMDLWKILGEGDSQSGVFRSVPASSLTSQRQSLASPNNKNINGTLGAIQTTQANIIKNASYK
jgi:hypothetical protein